MRPSKRLGVRHTIALSVALTTASILLLLLKSSPPRWWAASCFASSVVIFWARIRGRSERLAAACLGIAISTAYQITHREAGAWGIALAYGVGSAAIVVAFARSWLGEADDTASRLRTALVTSLFPAKLYFGLILLTAAAAGTPQTFDTVLTAIDQSLAGNVSFSTGRLLEAHDIVHALVLIAYDAAPVMVMLAAAFRWRRFGARDATSLPLAAALAAASGVILYRLVPAAGPVYRWGPSFPSLLPLADLALVPSPVDIGAFRNAMPSLHFAGALFVAWGTWDLGWLRRLFGLGFLALTALATLGTGQHYLVDLVVAVPFALAVEASVRRPSRWMVLFLSSTGVALTWMLAIRLIPKVLVIPGVALAGSLATAFSAGMVARVLFRGWIKLPPAGQSKEGGSSVMLGWVPRQPDAR